MSLRFDLSDFQHYARKMDALASQIPFALAQSLNASAEIARKEIIETTWPEHVQVRNARFMAAALTTKGTRATKRSLRVEVYDRLGRARGSDRDYEALAAARAIGKTLVGQGLSFHDLADDVEAGRAPPISNPYFDFAWDPPEPAHRSPPTWNDLRDFERRDWLVAFVRQLDITDPTEMRDLIRFRSQYVHRSDERPTRRQLELFTRLMSRAWKIGVRP